MLYNGLLTVFTMQFISGLVTRLDRSLAEAIAARAVAALHDELPLPDFDLTIDSTADEGGA